ncbi:MAG: hypothetical protein ACRDOK_30640 [Streptosporangiaceae bacterium]
MRIALLDDYQNVGLSNAPWRESLPDSSVVAFTRHIADPRELASELQPFHAIVAMRERTAFSRGLLEQLPRLRLLVTTSNRNAAIDLVAAKAPSAPNSLAGLLDWWGWVGSAPESPASRPPSTCG